MTKPASPGCRLVSTAATRTAAPGTAPPRTAPPITTAGTVAVLGLAISVAITAVGGAAHAQSPSAETLFREGMRLKAQGKLAPACEALEAANRAEPGSGTLLELGECREWRKQLASAWSAYKAALDRATKPTNKRLAQAKLDAIKPHLSYLTISVANEDGAANLTITRNGAALDSTLWNRALPADGGDHVIEARAPGSDPWQVTVHVPDEAGRVVVVVPLPRRPDPAPSADRPRTALQPSPASPVAEAAPAPPSEHRSTRRTLAVAAAATSVLAVAAGTVLGISAKTMQSEAHALCPDSMPYCRNADSAAHLTDSGHARAIGANVAFGLGGVAAVAAITLWFTGAPDAPRSIAVAPAASPSQLVVTASGRF